MKILRAEISGALRYFLRLFLIELVHLFTQSGTFLLHFADGNILFSKFLEIAHRLVGVFLRLAENSLCLLGCIGDHLFFSCVDLFLILGKALLQRFDFRAVRASSSFSRSSVIRFCSRVVRTSSNDSSCSLISSFALLMM